jgi:hypothetical protein
MPGFAMGGIASLDSGEVSLRAGPRKRRTSVHLSQTRWFHLMQGKRPVHVLAGEGLSSRWWRGSERRSTEVCL